MVKKFSQPDGSIKTFGNVCWFTNLDIPKRHEDLVLYKQYTPEEYQAVYDVVSEYYDGDDIEECNKFVEKVKNEL